MTKMLEIMLLVLNIALTLVNLFFALVRTYYARYAKKTYDGSVEYWSSWEKRKFQVAVEVLKELGVDDPEKALKDLRKKNYGKKKGRKK